MDIFYALGRAALVILLVIALTRANGLRSFSKMSSYDFAITVAKGSVLASAVLATSPGQFWTAMAAMAALFVIQGAISRVRQRSSAAARGVDNAPMFLMRDGEILEENLTRGQITRADLLGKLREANVHKLADVRAVVLESTGDVSVMQGPGPVEAEILGDVRQ